MTPEELRNNIRQKLAEFLEEAKDRHLFEPADTITSAGFHPCHLPHLGVTGYKLKVDPDQQAIEIEFDRKPVATEPPNEWHNGVDIIWSGKFADDGAPIFDRLVKLHKPLKFVKVSGTIRPDGVNDFITEHVTTDFLLNPEIVDSDDGDSNEQPQEGDSGQAPVK